MDTLNAALTRCSDWLLGPLAGLPPLVTLSACALLAGFLAALAFRYASNQRALRRVGDQIRANLLALRLFRDELGVALACQAGLLKAAALRFWYALPAFGVLGVPFVLLLAQLALRFEHRPLRPGEAAVVELRISPRAWPAAAQIHILRPAGLTLETPRLRDPQQRALFWRVSATAPGALTLRWRVGRSLIDKRLDVARDGRALRAVSATRPGRDFWGRLLHPGEPALPPNCPVRAIVVRYPRRTTPVLGCHLPWWVTFLLVSILAALLARPLLKVRF